MKFEFSPEAVESARMMVAGEVTFTAYDMLAYLASRKAKPVHEHSLILGAWLRVKGNSLTELARLARARRDDPKLVGALDHYKAAFLTDGGMTPADVREMDEATSTMLDDLQAGIS